MSGDNEIFPVTKDVLQERIFGLNNESGILLVMLLKEISKLDLKDDIWGIDWQYSAEFLATGLARKSKKNIPVKDLVENNLVYVTRATAFPGELIITAGEGASLSRYNYKPSANDADLMFNKLKAIVPAGKNVAWAKF